MKYQNKNFPQGINEISKQTNKIFLRGVNKSQWEWTVLWNTVSCMYGYSNSKAMHQNRYSWPGGVPYYISPPLSIYEGVTQVSAFPTDHLSKCERNMQYAKVWLRWQQILPAQMVNQANQINTVNIDNDFFKKCKLPLDWYTHYRTWTMSMHTAVQLVENPLIHSTKPRKT